MSESQTLAEERQDGNSMTMRVTFTRRDVDKDGGERLIAELATVSGDLRMREPGPGTLSDPEIVDIILTLASIPAARHALKILQSWIESRELREVEIKMLLKKREFRGTWKGAHSAEDIERLIKDLTDEDS